MFAQTLFHGMCIFAHTAEPGRQKYEYDEHSQLLQEVTVQQEMGKTLVRL